MVDESDEQQPAFFDDFEAVFKMYPKLASSIKGYVEKRSPEDQVGFETKTMKVAKGGGKKEDVYVLRGLAWTEADANPPSGSLRYFGEDGVEAFRFKTGSALSFDRDGNIYISKNIMDSLSQKK